MSKKILYDEKYTNKEDDDAFWEVAFLDDDNGLASNRQRNGFHRQENDDDDNSTECLLCDKESSNMKGRTTKYVLPNTNITLRLASLAPEDGIWSPVGADAWYASAVLTSLIMQEIIDNQFDTYPTSRTINGSNTDQLSALRVLELGSGAKGLPGLACATALSLQPERFPAWTVTVTDNDKEVLKQLKFNVKNNLSKIIKNRQDKDSNVKAIKIEYLDWSDNFEINHDNFNNESADYNPCLLSADLVLGSELAYTHDTATALVKIVLTLLHHNPRIKIFIVQVADRYGWSEVVLPSLESHNNIKIHMIPLTWHIHEMASSLIQMGGTLDRHAFGAYCISNV